MKRMFLILFLVYGLCATAGEAIGQEVYKWVDEKGTVHFTQDPSTIPEKYVDKVKSRTLEENVTIPEERGRANRQNLEKLKIEESKEQGTKQRGEVEIIGFNTYESSLGIRGSGPYNDVHVWERMETCASITIRNGTSQIQQVTHQTIRAITSRKVGTRFETPASRSPGPSMRSPSYNPHPVAVESSDTFTPKPFNATIAPRQTTTVSACFGRQLPIARVELIGF